MLVILILQGFNSEFPCNVFMSTSQSANNELIGEVIGLMERILSSNEKKAYSNSLQSCILPIVGNLLKKSYSYKKKKSLFP